LARVTELADRIAEAPLPQSPNPIPPPGRYSGDHTLAVGWSTSPLPESSRPVPATQEPSLSPHAIDPFFLFACYVEWEQQEDPAAGWELIAASQSPHEETRAQARALLSNSHHLGGTGSKCFCPPV